MFKVIPFALVAVIGWAAGVHHDANATKRPQRSTAFIVQHTNQILDAKCRPRFPASTLRTAAIRRHRIAHRMDRAKCRPDPAPPVAAWTYGYATWYGPGFYGSSPACGGSGLTESSWWVATIPARCGVMVTVCASRCVRAPSMDTGAFPSSNVDMTPAVARALGGLHTHRVRWHWG